MSSVVRRAEHGAEFGLSDVTVLDEVDRGRRKVGAQGRGRAGDGVVRVKAVVHADVDLGTVQERRHFIAAGRQLVKAVQFRIPPRKSAASAERVKVLPRVREVDIEADDPRVGKQQRPHGKAGAPQNADFHNRPRPIANRYEGLQGSGVGRRVTVVEHPVPALHATARDFLGRALIKRRDTASFNQLCQAADVFFGGLEPLGRARRIAVWSVEVPIGTLESPSAEPFAEAMAMFNE